MRLDPAHLEHARKVADAILYEGYLLYPYRRSAAKNQVRFQFGVLMPPGYRELDDSEPSASQTECLLECTDDAEILVVLRFLQLQRRTVQAVSPDDGHLREVGTLSVDGTEYTSWDEAAEREQHITVPAGRLLEEDRNAEFHASEGQSEEPLTDSRGHPAGRLVREWAAADGMIRLHAERVAGPYQALKLRVRVENHSASRALLRTRTDGLRQALIAAHLLIGVPGGRFLSLTDPPEWAAAEAGQCVNTGTWPVLAGPQGCTELMLSSPVILYDHAEVAAESPADLFDATEIDEILTLRTMALTDEEKREARSSDPRAADLIDRMDHLPPEMLDRLHGAIRYLRPVGGPDPDAPPRAGACAAALGRARGRDHRPPGRAVVGSGRGPLGVTGDRPRRGGRRAGGQRQPGDHAPGHPPGRRPGPVPGRPGRHRAGRAARRRRRRPPGRQPRPGPGRRAAAQPRPVSLLRAGRGRAHRPGGRHQAPPGRPGVARGRRTARGGNGMVSRLIKLAVLALVITVIVQSLPDIKRYLEIRDM